MHILKVYVFEYAIYKIIFYFIIISTNIKHTLFKNKHNIFLNYVNYNKIRLE